MRLFVLITALLLISLGIFLMVFCLFGHEKANIGLVGAMSGKYAAYGKSMHQAMRLLRDQINNAGGINGRRMELIVKDDEGNEEKAKNMAKEFVDEDQVSIVIGHYFTDMSLAAQNIYKDNNIPVITPSATNVNVTR
jgi:branched-chain amino acid transport system substrate-binding protein